MEPSDLVCISAFIFATISIKCESHYATFGHKTHYRNLYIIFKQGSIYERSITGYMMNGFYYLST